jgi:hypothetical protein
MIFVTPSWKLNEENIFFHTNFLQKGKGKKKKGKKKNPPRHIAHGKLISMASIMGITGLVLSQVSLRGSTLLGIGYNANLSNQSYLSYLSN